MGGWIPEGEVEFEFLRSSGPGGQNVNKVETAVRLRFDVRRSASLADDVKERLLRLAGTKATAAGEIVLLGRRHRTRESNRQDVLARLEALVERARVAPRRRRATRPTAGSRERKLDDKRRRARTKSGRRAPAGDD